MQRPVLRSASLILALASVACERAASPPPAQPASSAPSLATYFALAAGVDTAGVRLVPIQTPKGSFKVWTKRFLKQVDAGT